MSTKIVYDPKDPDERDDFKLNWTRRLAPLDDEVYMSSWTIVTNQDDAIVPLNIYDQDIINDNKSTRFWVEGGDEGTKYEILNEIETTGGRLLQQTIYLPVKSH